MAAKKPLIDENSSQDEKKEAAIEMLLDALRMVVEWNARTPQATLRQIRQIAQATLDEVAELLKPKTA